MNGLRADLSTIAALVPERTRVLDIGCGDGALLAKLRDDKGVDARGIELDAANVAAAVARGLSVVQGDADADLAAYPSRGFDLAILSQTLQAVRRPRAVLGELLRIGERAIVSFPNFGYWRVRMALLTRGRMPVTPCLPTPWHETPNIHLCTIADFEMLARETGATIETARFLGPGGEVAPGRANLWAEQAIYVLRG